MKLNKLFDVCEKLDWDVNEYETDVELRKYSPAGEDFIFCVDKDDFINNVIRYTNCFDPDEHIEMWVEVKANGGNGIPSIRKLVEDADDIQEMLDELADALRELL